MPKVIKSYNSKSTLLSSNLDRLFRHILRCWRPCTFYS